MPFNKYITTPSEPVSAKHRKKTTDTHNCPDTGAGILVTTEGQMLAMGLKRENLYKDPVKANTATGSVIYMLGFIPVTVSAWDANGEVHQTKECLYFSADVDETIISLQVLKNLNCMPPYWPLPSPYNRGEEKEESAQDRKAASAMSMTTVTTVTTTVTTGVQDAPTTTVTTRVQDTPGQARSSPLPPGGSAPTAANPAPEYATARAMLCTGTDGEDNVPGPFQPSQFATTSGTVLAMHERVVHQGVRESDPDTSDEGGVPGLLTDTDGEESDSDTNNGESNLDTNSEESNSDTNAGTGLVSYRAKLVTDQSNEGNTNRGVRLELVRASCGNSFSGLRANRLAGQPSSQQAAAAANLPDSGASIPLVGQYTKRSLWGGRRM